MPVTRRQSENGRTLRAPPPQATDDKASPEEWYESELSELTESGMSDFTEESELSELEDSGSEWGGTGTIPVAKRAKTTITSNVQLREKFWSRLMHLPLNILFEIFGHLTSTNLLNLARTNKTLRKILMTRKSITAWRNARDQGQDAPPCPDDVPEPFWANLILGGTVCQVCGTKGIQRVVFSLRRRVCTKCLKNNLVYSGSFSKKFPDFDISILDLLPYTNTGGWSHGHASNSRFYWNEDIINMAKTLGRYQRDVHMRKPGARQALADFRAAQIQLADTVMQHAEECTKWSLESSDRIKTEGSEDLVRRLAEHGHEQQDIECLRDYGQLDRFIKKVITDKTWPRIRSEVEPLVEDAKQRRLLSQRTRIITSRKQVIEGIYAGYKKMLKPLQWTCLPILCEVFEQEPFKTLINCPPFDVLDQAHNPSINQSLIAFIESYKRKRTSVLLSLVPDSFKLSLNVGAAPKGSESEIDILALVACVFSCDNDSCQYSRRNGLPGCATLHYCNTNINIITIFGLAPAIPIEPRFTFNTRGSTAVMSIMESLHLVACETTPSKLDSLDLRVVCLDCPITTFTNRKAFGRPALCWRRYVSHYICAPSASHRHPQPKIIPPADASAIKSQEQADPATREWAWCCSHCHEHFNRYQQLPAVISHLRTSHAIDNPIEGSDFLYMLPERPLRTSNQMYIMGSQRTDSDKQYVCMRCRQDKLRCVQGIAAHLKAKHSIFTPVLSQDYRCVGSPEVHLM